MSCKNVCRLCNRLVLSQSVSFTGGNLIINIPAGSYYDEQKYCIVVAQSVPSTATITAPVYVTIGTGTVQYPLTKCDCSQATACSIASRTRYSVRLETTPTGGTFHMLGKVCCVNRNLASVNGTAPTAAASTQSTGDAS
jgi:hypothetical protein